MQACTPPILCARAGIASEQAALVRLVALYNRLMALSLWRDQQARKGEAPLTCPVCSYACMVYMHDCAGRTGAGACCGTNAGLLLSLCSVLMAFV